MQEKSVETTVYSLAAAAPAQPNRRGGERHLSLLRVGAILIEGRRELCLIRNISAGGMMIRAYSPIKPRMPISIELKQGDPVRGMVQWTDGDLAGVAFDTPIDVVALLAPPSEGPRPRLPRIEVESTAWVRQDADVIRTRTINVSQGGIRVQTTAALNVGGGVVVTLPGLTPAAGVVKWNEGEAYGIAFNRALILSELVQWLQDQQQDQRRRVAV